MDNQELHCKTFLSIVQAMEGFLDYFDSDGTPATVALSLGSMLIGSCAQSGLILGGCAAQVCELRWSKASSTWDLHLLSNETHVLINDQFVSGETKYSLHHRDIIEIAGHYLVFYKHPSAPRLVDLSNGNPDGVETNVVPLNQGRIVIGRRSENQKIGSDAEGADSLRWELDADDRGISRRHALVELDGFEPSIEHLGGQGTELNGVMFSRSRLIVGDRFRIRDYFFEFTGDTLQRVDQATGAHVEAESIAYAVFTKEEGIREILKGLSLDIKSGEFLGILGGSGQGKSTLMSVLCGLITPTDGQCFIDGSPPGTGRKIGFVPQEDIVHTDLTVRDALRLSAGLRVNAAEEFRGSLVDGIMKRLNLSHLQDRKISVISGGERKRVNIATELLNRPSILFLDEPSSGLDPANEEDLMALLQQLRLTGQTVVCTTHVLHKAYLFDRIAFIHDGQLMFAGQPSDAKEFFFGNDQSATASQTEKGGALERIYSLFKDNRSRSDDWAIKFAQSAFAPFRKPLPPLRRVVATGRITPPPGGFMALRVLIQRQWLILKSDRKNLTFLAAQAVIIGLLIGMVGRKDPEFRLFASMIAILWFGCSNASQHITREWAIFKRERVCGLGLGPYIFSKAIFLASITAIQSLAVLFCQAILTIGQSGTDGTAFSPTTAGSWLMVGTGLLTAVVGVMLGLSISAWTKTTTQAAYWVPLILIPQILFSGFVISQPDMPDFVRPISQFFPSSFSQRLVDYAHIRKTKVPLMVGKTTVPLFWATDFKNKEAKPIGEDNARVLDEYVTAWQNLAVDFGKIGKIDKGSESTEKRADVRRMPPLWQPGGEQWTAGESFELDWVMQLNTLGLLFWVGIGFGAVYLGLLKAQPEPLQPRWMRRR